MHRAVLEQTLFLVYGALLIDWKLDLHVKEEWRRRKGCCSIFTKEIVSHFLCVVYFLCTGGGEWRRGRENSHWNFSSLD
ncbi:hypothetical protein M758_UG211400 [Ceratodon purpureus]|nr:hypothetical protein M758_UG211400 [Ceratodon purpureus]